MEVQPDFRDLLESFNRFGVEYVIVGAYALAFHGVPREDAARGAIKSKYGEAEVAFLGRREFIANKRTTGRMRDLADLEALGE